MRKGERVTVRHDAAERQLRIALMTIQIEHLKGQIRWEPWKAMALAFGAGAAFTGALVAMITALLRALGH
jgi:hypothetical protein